MLSPSTPRVEAFFDAETSTFTYVLYTHPGGECAVIDSVLGFEPRAGRTATRAADRVIEFVVENGLMVKWLLETHAHADHLSAARYLQGRLGGVIAAGSGIRLVRGAFQKIFHWPEDAALDDSGFGRLFDADEIFMVGDIRVRAMHVPGHTPADVAYVVEPDDESAPLAFVGDTLFMPDLGSARCDFPGGCAHEMYGSVQRLLSLPPATRLFMCHDYPPAGRAPGYETTIAAQRASNVHFRDGIDEDAFVAMREQRDATLGMPALMLPAIQVNVRAGELPPVEANGIRYLRIPMDAM